MLTVIRLSKYHKEKPYSMNVNGQEFKVDYVPGDSNSSLFGGNSNWRGVSYRPPGGGFFFADGICF